MYGADHTGDWVQGYILTVTGVEGGSYQCIVSNVRGAVMSPVLSGAGRLFILMIYHSTITM